MKRIIVFTAVLATTPLVHAQLVGTDPISDILNQTLHIEGIAKQIEIIENQVEQINTLTKQLQQAQAYVKAFGDPEKLTSIVGADGLMTSLRQGGVGKTLDTIRSSASGSDALRYDANGLCRSIGTQFTTPNGAQLPRAEEVYRKFGAIQQSSLNLQSTANWNLNQAAASAPVPRETSAPQRVAASDAVVAEVNKQRAATRAFIEQTTTLNQKLCELSQAAGQSQEIARQNLALKRDVAALQQRIDAFDFQLRERKPEGTAPSKPAVEDKW